MYGVMLIFEIYRLIEIVCDSESPLIATLLQQPPLTPRVPKSYLVRSNIYTGIHFTLSSIGVKIQISYYNEMDFMNF